MTWKDLKTWLDKEIIDTTNPTLQLTDEAKVKYKLSELASSENEFNTALTNFYTSLEGTLDKHNDVHLLPAFEKDKSWDELFPRSTTRFGKKTEDKELAKDIYDKLQEIYEDWQNAVPRELAEEYSKANLDDLIKDEEIQNEMMTASFVNQMSSKQKEKMLKKWKGWLKKHNSLTVEQKKNLAEENKKVTKLVEILTDSYQNTSSAKEDSKQESDWTKNLPTKEIGIGIVIGLGIYLIYGWLGEKK